MSKSRNSEKKHSKSIILLLSVMAISILLQGCSRNESAVTTKNLQYNEYTDDMKLKVVSYAQTALDDILTSPAYSLNMRDYNVVRTNGRYKIEGKVSGEKFYMIIEWDYQVDEYFDVISLEVGGTKIK